MLVQERDERYGSISSVHNNHPVWCEVIVGVHAASCHEPGLGTHVPRHCPKLLPLTSTKADEHDTARRGEEEGENVTQGAATLAAS